MKVFLKIRILPLPQARECTLPYRLLVEFLPHVSRSYLPEGRSPGCVFEGSRAWVEVDTCKLSTLKAAFEVLGGVAEAAGAGLRGAGLEAFGSSGPT